MQVAISSGHKRSVVLACLNDELTGESPRPIVVTTGDSLNLHCLVQQQFEETKATMATRLKGLLEKLRGELPKEFQREFRETDRLAISLPGVSSALDYEIGCESVRRAAWPVADRPNFCIVDDTFAGLLAGAKSTLGCCAFAGTGASVFVGTSDGGDLQFAPDKSFKFDGYGAMLGDHGSGFRLALSTLEHICRDLDKTGWILQDSPVSKGAFSLLDSLLRVMHPLNEPLNNYLVYFQNWFDKLMANRTPDWRFTIADLSKVINRAADRGNGYAQNRVDEAAHGIVTTLEIAIRLSADEDMENVPIYCQGGLFRNCTFYVERVREHLRRRRLTNSLELAGYRPCVGTLFMACSSNWTVPGFEQLTALEKAIQAVPAPSRALLLSHPDHS